MYIVNAKQMHHSKVTSERLRCVNRKSYAGHLFPIFQSI